MQLVCHSLLLHENFEKKSLRLSEKIMFLQISFILLIWKHP